MDYGTSFVTDNNGLQKSLASKAGYVNIYGGTIQTFFKPFTTNATGNGVAHYYRELRGTGIFADASGLNPLGPYTLNEGILHGYTMPNDIDLDPIDANNARLHGLKTPTSLVGPGFDVWGYPVPNFNSQWDISGSISDTVPSTGYLGLTGSMATHLRDVPSPLWKAGPLDMRWDQERGVWTSPIGVFPARISRVVATGITNPATGYFWADQVKYDAVITDGIANPISITGVSHIGPVPESGTYKIRPHSSGDFCFMVRYLDSSVPSYGIWLTELPGTDSCTSAEAVLELVSVIPTYSGAVDGDPFDSTRYLTGSGLAEGLATYPIAVEYGGIGLNTIGSNELLVGTTGNTFVKKQIVGVSGVTITHSATGIVVGMFDVSGIYANAGINTNITQISGLTTPLSIALGGTSATSRVWVSTTGNESVSGIKTFQNQIRFSEGTRTSLAIAYNKVSTIGFFVDPSGQGLMSVYFGTGYFSVNSTGSRSWGKFLAKNDLDATSPAMQVRQTVGSTNYPFVVEDTAGTGYLYLGSTGIQFGKVGNSTTVVMTTGVVGNHGLTIPSGGTIPNTVYVYSHLVGPERLSGVADGVNLTFYTQYSVYNTGVLMVFRNGILQGQGTGEDFVLSNSTGIIFNTGFGPASGDILKATYQRIM